MSSTKKYRIFTVKLLAGAGYLMVFLEGLWLLALYLPSFMHSNLGRVIFPLTQPLPSPKATPAHPVELSTLMTVAGVLAACALMGLVVYLIVAKYIPAVSNATAKVAHATTKKAVPMIARKPTDKISPRKRKALTERTLFWVKIMMAVVPVAIVVAVHSRKNTVQAQLVVFGFAILSFLALASFSLQTWLSRYWKIGGQIEKEAF